MMPKFVVLWTDAALFALVILIGVYAWRAVRSRTLRASWSRVARSPSAMCSAIVLLMFVLVGLLDSIHYQPRLPPVAGAAPDAPVMYAPKLVSVLDAALGDTAFVKPEKTYSQPLAYRQFVKESMLGSGGQVTRDFPRLKFGGRHLDAPESQWASDVSQRAFWGFLGGAAVATCLVGLLLGLKDKNSPLPWRAIFATLTVICCLFGVTFSLASGYHVLGTDGTGTDVLWRVLKSIRTAWVIGGLTTAFILPPALLLGIAAGYFKGWIDDVIQYVYSTLTSIPSVLLIAACVLMMQVFIDTHASSFPTAEERADIRLFTLCMILGLTGWSGLCRLLRAESLKLRELEYVQAAKAFGISSWRIMLRHLLPNVMHLVLITIVLEFSSLVLYEAVLSYLGIGVDPTMNSFGSMIEKSRLEISRDPMIWWSLFAAFAFMLTLVLSANLFSDGVRDAFDPKSRLFRPRRFNKPVLTNKDRIALDLNRLTERQARPDQAPLLELKDLEIGIDVDDELRYAVKALSLTITRGETFALVGESGSGKSMTAFALMRLLPDALKVTAGQVVLDGQDLNQLSEAHMRSVRGGRIGMIFQEPATSLNPVMRIGDQIIEPIEQHTALRGKDAKSRALQWLDRVGIPDAAKRIDDYPFQFSGGQKQRIMIAIALAAEPALLVADEPTTALDVTVQAQVLALIAEIQRELGMAVLLITHDLAVVRDVADTVALMRQGEIVETAPANEFFTSPKHPYARELFDAIPTYAKRGQPLSRLTVLAGGHAASYSKLAPESAHEVALSVQDLQVHYRLRAGFLKRTVGWTKVVEGVSFELHKAETLAVVGGSGCGKTTVAKALLRLIEPSAHVAGSVALGGQSITLASRGQLVALRQKIQMVFQDPYASLDPRMRVTEILMEGIEALRPEWSVVQRQARLAYLLARVGLPDDAGMRFSHEFSGGQRQRIAIARALAVEPQVLVLDEPTSALDVSVQAQILDLLKDLQRETGMAYIFITHNFGVVEYIADRVAVMDAGRLVEVGSAQDVLHHAKHEVTKTLLAAVPRLSFA